MLCLSQVTQQFSALLNNAGVSLPVGAPACEVMLLLVTCVAVSRLESRCSGAPMSAWENNHLSEYVIN